MFLKVLVWELVTGGCSKLRQAGSIVISVLGTTVYYARYSDLCNKLPLQLSDRIRLFVWSLYIKFWGTARFMQPTASLYDDLVSDPTPYLMMMMIIIIKQCDESRHKS